jgi:hypothetical protein
MNSLLSALGMDSVYGDLSYYNEIRWLACHKVLKVFFAVCEIVLLWK